MILMRSQSRRRIIVAAFAIFGLFLHMAMDALPVKARIAATSELSLNKQQNLFFTALRQARAVAIISGKKDQISVDEFSLQYNTDLALNALTGEGAGPGGSNEPSSDTLADDCPGCLSDYNPLIGLINAPQSEQFLRVHIRVAGLPPLADPKWLNAHILFEARAPPLAS